MASSVEISGASKRAESRRTESVCGGVDSSQHVKAGMKRMGDATTLNTQTEGSWVRCHAADLASYKEGWGQGILFQPSQICNRSPDTNSMDNYWWISYHGDKIIAVVWRSGMKG